MNFTPLPQQRLMINHLLSHPEALLFCDPGTGKSAAVIETIATLITDFEIRAALIVAPLRVCTLTWPDEVEKYEEFSWLRVADMRTYDGKQAWCFGTAHIYLINYDQLQSFAAGDWGINKYCPVDMVVWDEVSRAKDPSSKRIKAMKPFRSLFKRHVGLTGTPAPNSYLDLFAQVRLIDGGVRLGTGITSYRQRYFDQDYTGYKYTIKPWAKEAIEKNISDVTLTMRKEEWMHLPPTEVRDVEIQLPPEVRKQYKELQKELLLQIRDREITAVNMGVLVNKLLQMTSGAIYDQERVVSHVHDVKIDALKSLAKRVEGPLLVAANFIHEKERIVAAIPGAEHFREDRLESWNRGEIPCWVADPRSVGHGLNLQGGAADIVWFSLTYSRELYDQMNARLIRTGQTKPTTIHRLICKGTVDEVVAEVLRIKGDGQASLMTALTYLEKLNVAVYEREKLQ